MNLEKFIDVLKHGNFEEQNVRIAIFDKEARFKFVSTTFFGFSEDYIGMSVYDYYRGHLSESEIKKVEKCFEVALGGKPSCDDVILSNGFNHDQITWTVEFNPFVDDKGDTYILSKIRPHEVSLSNNSTNFFIREMLEQSSDVFTVFDEDFKIVYVSKAYDKLRGERTLGTHISKLLQGKALDDYYRRYKRAKEKPGEIITEILNLEITNKDGATKEYILESSVEYHDFGQLGIYYLDRTSDVTEKVLRNREIEVQKTAIDKMSKWTALGQMAANIAHEVNNPLAIIDLQIQSVERHGKSLSAEKIIDKLRSIASQKTRISNIVSSLNIFSDDNKSIRESYALSSIIHDAIALFKTRLIDDDFKIVFSNDTDSDIVMVNASEIIQVLLNLLNNAHDAIYNLEGKWIEINLYDEEEFVILDITDSGTGIKDEIADRIFERFFTTKSDSKGTGLGLNIGEEIIRDHKGTLIYDPNSHHTTFTISIPKA